MNKSELTILVEEGKSIQDIAVIYEKSKTAVRHWLKKYNLTTTGKAGAKTFKSLEPLTEKLCKKCDNILLITSFYQRGDRNTAHSYCSQCMRDDVNERSRNSKQFYVNALGDKCKCCEQTFPAPIYDFHHTAPEHKDFTIRTHKLANPTTIAQELDKCVLLCHNCHMQVHHEMKKRDGYDNKIKGNSELWNTNKKRKLDIIGRYSCDDCGYDHWVGNLAIVFDDKTFLRYNKTHFDDEFIDALGKAKIRCQNCVRLSQSDTKY